MREFQKKTDGLQVLLSQAVLLGHSDLVEEAVQLSNSFFTQFTRGGQDFAVGMKGIHLISHYKGVQRCSLWLDTPSAHIMTHVILTHLLVYY